MLTFARRAAPVCGWVILAACHGGGGGGGTPAPGTTYTIGGTVSGLVGSGLVLQDNAGNDLAIGGSGAFTFSTALASGAAYNVTVLAQPETPSQTCIVTGGSGAVGGANVTTAQINCTTNSYPVEVSVTGLDADGLGLVLQNNGGNDLAVNANGAFDFATQVPSGSAYTVTVKSQPTSGPFQLCSVTNGSGTVGKAAPNVAVTCVLRFFKYLYLPAQAANQIGAYKLRPSDGHLIAVPGQPFPSRGTFPSFAVPELTGKFLLVSNRGSAIERPTVAVYAVDGATGSLAEIAASPYDLSSVPMDQPAPNAVILPPVAVHPSDAFGYVVAPSNTTPLNRLYGATIDSATGELAQIPGLPIDMGVGTSINGNAFDSAGKYLFVASNSGGGVGAGQMRSFEVSVPSGVLTPIGGFPTSGNGAAGVVLTPAGDYLLTANFGSGTIMVFAVNKSAGTLTPTTTPVPTGPAGSFPTGIVFNRRTNVFYVSNVRPGPVSTAVFRLDVATGIPTMVGGPVDTNGAARPGFIHPSGRFYYQYNDSTSAIQRFAIDQTTGALMLAADVTSLPSTSM